MPTPTPDKISINYASKGLAADGTPTERTVHSTTNAMVFRVNNISEPTGFWDGATGYFTNTQTVALRGQTFHVRFWDKESNNLTLASPLPTPPVSGDKFIIFAGGKQASTKEVLCMLAGGKQPEIETVTGTNCTGVTIKKISPLLGVGTLQLYYTNSSNVKTLKIRMTTTSDYGPEVTVEYNLADDSQRFIECDGHGAYKCTIYGDEILYAERTGEQFEQRHLRRSEHYRGVCCQMAHRHSDAVSETQIKVSKKCGCRRNRQDALDDNPARPSCLECTEKHLGAAFVLLSEIHDGYSYRLRLIGHLHEAEDESQQWPTLHNAIRQARKDYQRAGTTPDWEMLGRLIEEVRHAG